MILQFETHPFHIVEERPWPLYMGASRFFLLLSLVDFFWFSSYNFVLWGFLLKIWSRDIIRERVFSGSHTQEAELGFKWGMGWFITSEVFFYFFFTKMLYMRKQKTPIEIEIRTQTPPSLK
jgi:hypothetical protein